jgi:peroxiredoxin
MLRTAALLWFTALWSLSVAVADDQPSSPEQAVGKIINEMKNATVAYKATSEAAHREGKSDEYLLKLQEKHNEQLLEGTQILMKIAKSFSWHPSTADALSWVITHGEPRDNDLDEAFNLLIANHMSINLQPVNHLSRDCVADLCLGLMNRYPFGRVAAFYRIVMGRTENRKVRAYAIYALACRSRKTARRIRDGLSKPSPTGRESEVHYTESEARRLGAEADTLFQQLIDEYADVPLGPDRLGEVVAANLAAARVEVGRAAPEIEGVDVEGHHFKLSSYRGKVVVVSFWAGWCRPCIELVPEERSLIEKMKSKPVVLLGVNSDETMGAFRKVNEEEQISWRSWWDGENDLISTTWNVHKWPTLYIIDRKGVIRSGRIDVKRAEQMIDQLLKEP